MGKSLAVFQDSCFPLHSFLAKNAKKRLFWRKIILSEFLLDLKCSSLQSGLADSEIHQTLAYGRFLTHFENNTFF